MPRCRIITRGLCLVLIAVLMAPPLKRMKETRDLRLTAEIDYAKLLHEAQVVEEGSNFACCLSGDRGSVCAGSSAGVVTTWDLMAEGRPVAAAPGG